MKGDYDLMICSSELQKIVPFSQDLPKIIHSDLFRFHNLKLDLAVKKIKNKGTIS